jgi:hypothetical protein
MVYVSYITDLFVQLRLWLSEVEWIPGRSERYDQQTISCKHIGNQTPTFQYIAVNNTVQVNYKN